MENIKHFINFLTDPKIVLPMLMLIFPFVFPPTEKFYAINQRLRIYKLWTKQGGILLFSTLSAFFFFGLSDRNFRLIVTKPDNVPIVGLLFLTFFFLFLFLKTAY